MTHDQVATTGTERPRYATLEDYLQVLRRRWLLIVAFTVVGIAAGLALTLSKEKTYTATSNLSFRDISQDQAFLGVDSRPSTAPALLAAVNAELVTRPEIATPVVRRFRDELAANQVIAAVDARVSVSTGLVALQATAADPELAARIANAFARRVRQVGVEETDNRLRRAEKSIRDEVDSLIEGPSADRGDVLARVALLEGQLTRLETLRQIALPVEILNEASAAGASPSGSSPQMGAVLGGALGLILGLLAGFARDALDRRVRSVHEVSRELGLPVLGRIPASAFGRLGLVADGGGAPLSDVDFEAFRALRTNLGYLRSVQPDAGEVRCVLVTSARPDDGKTTVSASLASAAAAGGQRVLLIEGDLRRPCFADRFGIPAAPGFSDFLAGAAEPQQVVRTLSLVPPSSSAPNVARLTQALPKLACMSAGSRVGDAAELLLSERLRQMMDEVRSAYDLVVVDSSPILAVADSMELVRYVDAVLVCVRAHSTTRDELRGLRAVLSNLPPVQTSAVVTGLRRGGPDSYEYYYGY